MEQVKVQINEAMNYKKANELSSAEIKKLPRFLVTLKKIENKKRDRIYYSLILFIDKDKLTKTLRLEQVSFELLRFSLQESNIKFDGDVISLKCPVRFIKGVNKNGNEYHLAQIIITKNESRADFLNPNELSMLAHLESRKIINTIDWVFKPSDIEDELDSIERFK